MVRTVESYGTGGGQKYAVMHEGASVPPDFARTFRGLSDPELLEEIALGRGGDDFQEAARGEAARRGLR